MPFYPLDSIIQVQSTSVTRRLPIALAAILLLAASPVLHAQINRNVIFLDPAHGGPDPGAQLSNHAAEKDVTLAFNAKLRAALATAGFTAISPRDADPSAIISADQRAALANRTHPLACILLHVTASGTGVHLFTSPNAADPTQSDALANIVGTNLLGAKLPVLLTYASIAPLDSLACPAIALEIAPLPNGDSTTQPTDASYQQRIAKAVTAALQKLRSQLPPPPPRPAEPTPAPGVTP
jgi:N-acetylmuramoyl-L-alanine amidase